MLTTLSQRLEVWTVLDNFCEDFVRDLWDVRRVRHVHINTPTRAPTSTRKITATSFFCISDGCELSSGGLLLRWEHFRGGTKMVGGRAAHRRIVTPRPRNATFPGDEHGHAARETRERGRLTLDLTARLRWGTVVGMDEPKFSDCANRGTPQQADCAAKGCGFCYAARRVLARYCPVTGSCKRLSACTANNSRCTLLTEE